MKTTLRSWTWEWGLLVMFLGWVPVLGLILVGGWASMAGVVLLCLYAWYSGYLSAVVSCYPTKGDLPEWQEYAKLRRLERDAHWLRVEESDRRLDEGVSGD
jgi:hypothetical protein